MREFQSQLAVTDVWHLVNPDAQEYSFYSGAHNSYCRIDYIIMSSNLVQNVPEIKMNCIVIRVYAVVSVTFFPWANNEKFIDCIINQILEIFVLN